MSSTKQIINLMVYFNELPKEGGFEITPALIDKFREYYGEVNNVNRNPKLNTTNLRYSRKLAAINLLKENLDRGVKCKSGIVYAISNPSFPGYYKVGVTQDLDKRLNSYQTYDPFRKFKVEHYRFVEDKLAEERKILKQFKTDLAKGEWIVTDRISDIFPETL